MAKLSYIELNALVNSIMTQAKLSNASFIETRDNIVGLIDKIGKIYTIDTVYNIDKLNFFDGEYLSFGKTIEEWQQDLILPASYDSAGANALAPNDPSYRPVFYSYSLGRKIVKTTIRNNNIERAVHNEGEFQSVVAMNVKRLQDSMASYRYEMKRELVGKLMAQAEAEMDFSTATAVGSISASTPVGTIIKNSTTNIGILVKPYSSGTKDWATQTANGCIIELALTQEVPVPEDDSTGEAFLTQVKKDVEKALDLNEGNSLNGNSLGATEGLVLIVKQGIMPELDVKTMAGAFHLDKVAVPVEVVVVKDFGSYSGKGYALLCDKRGCRLHNTYRAEREQFNAEGDFLNIVDHTEDTASYSRNTFVKVYLDD